MNQQQAGVVARLIHHASRYASNPAPSRRLKLEDAIEAAKALPDPGCPYCDGDGCGGFEHTPGCKGDEGGCEMTGVAGDCEGVLVPCGCSIMDVLEDK